MERGSNGAPFAKGTTVGTSTNQLRRNSGIVSVRHSRADPIEAPYEFPIVPGSAEWIELAKVHPPWSLCEIPEEKLNQMSTPSLVASCLKYPMRLDLALFDDPKQGLVAVTERFNGLRELNNRTDAAESILKSFAAIKAENIDVDFQTAQKLNREGNVAGYVDLVYISAIIDSMMPQFTPGEREIICTQSLKLFLEMRQISGASGNDVPVAAMAAKLLLSGVAISSADGDRLDSKVLFGGDPKGGDFNALAGDGFAKLHQFAVNAFSHK